LPTINPASIKSGNSSVRAVFTVFLMANRAINSNAKKRGKIKEILILNEFE
jgi:hypothetical protein